jgi:hypothetical protein
METKEWYLSKGVMGSSGAAIACLVILTLKGFGIEAGNETETITSIIVTTFGVMSAIVGLVGRLKATTKITK